MSLRIIKREEVKKHSEDDETQWIVVEGKVINITRYKVKIDF
jgi:cytochrome b involved in lipid metabolism